MPTYYARGVTVRLGVNPLVDTITPNITLKKGDVAKKQCEKPEKELLNSQLLPEQRVNFPGDEHGFELNWLGGAPFMQAQAVDNLFEDAKNSDAVHSAPTVSSSRLRRKPARESHFPYGSDPLALSLHVKTSDTTFISGMDKQNKLQLKIEVFFNGQLSSCLFLPPYEIRSNTKTHHQVFAGYRVDYLAERPWVILPPDTAANGSARKIEKFLSGEERWKAIGAALRREACERGTDWPGNIPPSSRFLGALAAMKMPDQVMGWQKPGCRHFGVIDVVISAGEGRKVTSGTTYLTRPQRFADENFPLPILSHDSNGIVATAEDTQAAVSAAVGFDEDAEGENDSDYEPQPKRQALNPLLPATRSGPGDIQPPSSHKRRCDGGNKAVFTSFPGTPISLLSSTFSQVPANETWPFGPDRSCDELSAVSHNPSSSPERTRADYNNYSNITGSSDQRQVSVSTSQNMHSIYSSNMALSHSSPMPSSPYSLQSSESLLGQGTPNGILHERRASMDSAFASPFIPNTSHLRSHLNLGRQSHVPDFSPRHVPNMLPSIPAVGRQGVPIFGGLPFVAPHDRRMSMPLPPTGFFTVPVKPRSSLSPKKKPHPTNLKMPQRGFLLKRLIIIGKDSIRVVDHEWAIAQYIAENERSAGQYGPNVPQKPGILASASESVDSSSTAFNDRSRSDTTHTKASLAEATSQSHKSPYELTKEMKKQLSPLGAINGQIGPAGHSSDTEERSMTNKNGHAPINLILPLHKSEYQSRDIAQPLVPQRRTTSAINVLGVQGPKAITFLYDDPEAMIREEKRLARRSRSPIKSNNKPPIAAKPKISAPDERTDTLSSPLSSLATTPELGYEPKAGPISLTRLAEADSFAQVDGSPAHEQTTTLTFQKPASAMAANLAHSTPQFPVPKVLSTPANSSSPNTKKRKNESGRYLAKQPRSPDRLKTISNPPLNRDCVIAFAESQDQASERGVLRQIKSERQGVFAEEHVVFATRFYVAGN